MISAAAAIVISLLWANTQTLTPVQALARANGILEKNGLLTNEELAEADSLAEVAQKHAVLESWALLLQANVHEKKGERDEALELYQKVRQSNTAASLDAEIAFIRLSGATSKPFAAIESELTLANRDDLLPELTLLKGIAAEKEGEPLAAVLFYRSVRRNFPKSPAAPRAKQELLRLVAERPEIAGSIDPSERIGEIQTLILEGEISESLQATDQLLAETKERSAIFFEIQFLRESILRKAKRAEDADSVLEFIATKSLSPFAEKAALRSAKNAWNINDHHRALEHLTRLRERFPKSPEAAEARYIQARIYEELGEFKNAQNAYALLSDTRTAFQLVAQKRLAWMSLLANDLPTAAQGFAKLRTQAGDDRARLRAIIGEVPGSGRLPAEVADRLREFSDTGDEYLHATYWLAHCLKQLEPSLRPKRIDYTPEQLLQELSIIDTRGYYGYLARSVSQTPAASTTAAPQSLCTTDILGGLDQRLGPFEESPALSQLGAREVDWFVGRSLDIQRQLENEEPLFAFKLLAERALRLAKVGATNRAVELSEAGLRRIALAPERSPATKACEQRYLEIGYPAYRLNDYKSAASKHGIPLPLFYGISRTESHFNPDAISSAGALGLIQIMPATAKAEGWDGQTPLTDPTTNLGLGAKHLARLIRDYENTPPYTIAAYNAGSAAVNRWRIRYPGVTPEMWTELIGYPETNKYVKKVLSAADVYRRKLEVTAHE